MLKVGFDREKKQKKNGKKVLLWTIVTGSRERSKRNQIPFREYRDGVSPEGSRKSDVINCIAGGNYTHKVNC